MLTIKIGNTMLCLPTIRERDDEPYVVTSDGAKSKIDRNVIGQIRDWAMMQEAAEDVRYFLENIDEDNLEDGVTAELIEENMEDVIECYLNRRYDGENWYEDMYGAIESFAYDLKCGKEQ